MILKTLLVVSCLTAAVQCITQSELNKIDEALQPLVSSRKSAPVLVRLAFHDCVGGCDGCINVNNPDNAGLQPIIQDLEIIYKSNGLKFVLSRADFWAYAGQAALRQTVDWTKGVEQSELKISFQTGRVDCPTSPYTKADVELPSSNLNYEQLIEFYDTRFGMTDEQAVALMGAHTLGYAHRQNSGFSGMWVPKEESFQFNNNYYKDMLELPWWQKNIGNSTDPRWQWQATVKGTQSASRPTVDFGKPTRRPIRAPKPEYLMSLNADFCMLMDLKLDKNGFSSCNIGNCGFSAGASLIKKFAESQSLWLEKFSEAFTIMQSNGGTVKLWPVKPV